MGGLAARPVALVAAIALLLWHRRGVRARSRAEAHQPRAIYPVSGLQGPGGVDESRGALLAVERENQLGGVHGRAVRVRLVDVSASYQAAGAMTKLRKQGRAGRARHLRQHDLSQAALAAKRSGMLLWKPVLVGQQPADSGGGQSFFRMARKAPNLGRTAMAFIRDQLAPSSASTGLCGTR